MRKSMFGIPHPHKGSPRSEECRRKISIKAKLRKRLPHTKEAKKKISISHMGNTWGFQKGHKLNVGAKNYWWKGNNVGYNALHFWVRKIKIKPNLCECCKLKVPIDLANKGIYDRNPDNWEWLCRKCHMIKDGRIYKNLNQYK